MSEVSLSTCPRCLAEDRLRTISTAELYPSENRPGAFNFYAEFWAECRDCGWEWVWESPVIYDV